MNEALRVRVQGIALLGPGLDGWDLAAPRLADPALWQRAPTAAPAPTLLPATERRRAGLVVKASVAVAEAACQAAGIAPDRPATVFASSTGDPLVCHQLCEALATPERLVSPTRFTNSVHNVAAGYWHIATHSMQASTSLGAFDASAGAGLLEAAAQAVHGRQPVLLVACDVPYPEPLHTLRPLADTVAVALLLVPADSATNTTTGRRLSLTLAGDAAATPCRDAGLEALRTQVPAARLLPLLQLLAAPAAGGCVIEGLPGAALALQVDAA
ncbi:beta-ketoacyl synthase chain length factor [Pseudorhodoferax sp.]|uniref:beta-ketoacyl synthase chain length factor n=1 Tax=Pseudorhodoferax sp. TaxID=1993553 RepID=UPI002DD6B66A|nr:beta-ketoacyl synthase chain length factor [Pseudorhodoferax sp.]